MKTVLTEKFKKIIKKIRLKMSTFEAYYTKGLELYDKKKYPLAIKYFETAMKKKNAQPQAYYNIGLAYQNLNKKDLASEAYIKFLKAYPNDYSGLFNLALIYYEQKDYINAVEYFEKTLSIKLEEENIRALTKSYLHTGQIEKAIEFSEYIYNSDCDINCYFSIAQSFDRKHYLLKDSTFVDNALNMYLNILEKENKHFDACLAASVCYAKKGDWTNSIFYCEQALKINPNSYDANSQMGLVYYCADNMIKSINYYEIAFKINSRTDYKIYSNLAYAYEKNGEEEKAIKLFKELVRKFSNCPIKQEIRVHVRKLLQK